MNPPNSISFYQILGSQILGQGAHNTVVYKGIDTRNNQNVAIKVIPKNEALKNEVTKYLYESQKKTVQQIQSPFIVKTHNVIQTEDKCFIIMQQCLAGTLKQKIAKLKSTNRFPQSKSEILSLFSKILKGYLAINQKLFIHRDLKTQNIMLKSEDGDPVIIDFGYCQTIMGKRPSIQYNVGSPSYMAPQAYLKNLYSEKSDVWSLGIILYQMLTGQTPDKGQYSIQYFKEIDRNGRLNYTLSPSTDPVFVQLLNVSLEVRQNKRATAHKLKYIVDKAMIDELNRSSKARTTRGLMSNVSFMGNSVSPTFSPVSNQKMMSSAFNMNLQPTSNVQSPRNSRNLTAIQNNNSFGQQRNFQPVEQINLIQERQTFQFSRPNSNSIHIQKVLSPKIHSNINYIPERNIVHSMPVIPQSNTPNNRFIQLQNPHIQFNQNPQYPKSQVIMRPQLKMPQYITNQQRHINSTGYISFENSRPNYTGYQYQTINRGSYIPPMQPPMRFAH